MERIARLAAPRSSRKVKDFNFRIRNVSPCIARQVSANDIRWLRCLVFAKGESSPIQPRTERPQRLRVLIESIIKVNVNFDYDFKSILENVAKHF